MPSSAGKKLTLSSPAVSGSGIRTARSSVDKPGDVYLAAPRGIVDASDAGIGGNNITIAASANPVCEGTEVTFTATPVNGGTTPAYAWYVNDAPVGTNSATYAYIPTHGDEVYVILTSNATCATGSPATSSTVTMSVSDVMEMVATWSAGRRPRLLLRLRPGAEASGPHPP